VEHNKNLGFNNTFAAAKVLPDKWKIFSNIKGEMQWF
jgi:hypothetical protein